MDRVLAGRYELEVPLGRSGAGEVWRGNDMATRRPVVVRLVELALVDDPSRLGEAIARFRREATVISGLHHPNIVGAVDAGRIGNQLFMVMELAPGVSLAAMMDERGARGMGLFPASSVLRMAARVCAGLGAAHAAGIVHGEVNPGNLMVTPSLGVKIIDFGVARLLADNATRLMLPAQTVSTIAYMSPEQAQGTEVDGRADLYSLGCVMYQLLAGRPPFFSTLPSALLMMQVMDRAVPLGTVRPDLPPEVCQLVSDLLEKERDERPSNAEEVITRITDLRRMFGDFDDEEPGFEADRHTVMSENPLGGATRLDNFAAESVRSPVLTPERMAQLSWPDMVTTGPRGPAAGRPSRSSEPFGGPFPPLVPSQSGSMRAAPPTAARAGAWTDPRTGQGTGAGAGAPVPQWPAAPPPRRRSVWPGVLSALVAAVVVAGAGAYYWVHTYDVLKITNVGVKAAKPHLDVSCNGTANLIGTITTNGHAGPIKYEWILAGVKKGVVTVDAPSGSDTVRVTMSWAFHGKGKGQYVAELETITPEPGHGSLAFPYSCPK